MSLSLDEDDETNVTPDAATSQALPK